MILLQAYCVNTLNVITYHMLIPKHPTETSSTAQSGKTYVDGSPAPQRECRPQLFVPVCSQTAADPRRKASPRLSTGPVLRALLPSGQPHTLTAINALALRKTAEDVALQVWLYFSLHQVSYLGLVVSTGLKLCSHHLG